MQSVTQYILQSYIVFGKPENVNIMEFDFLVLNRFNIKLMRSFLLSTLHNKWNFHNIRHSHNAANGSVAVQGC